MPLEIADEQALIHRAQRGDADAIAQLYEVNVAAVYRYVYYRVRDPHTAEDITADVFLRMVEVLPRFEYRGVRFTAWLFRVAHDRLVDHHRRGQSRPVEPLLDTLPDGNAETERQALAAHANRDLSDRISELTEEQQIVLHLRFIEGYSLAETADILAKSQGAIKALQHRALRQLGRKLAS